ncbi:proteasome subunit RPN1 (RPN1) [Vairimorpha necatrix]|uniref:Proteasome subunit RPN1 (RPN1) n=1 Tax=Vairimorpha necatrix TaxID=6039 RepID=A0AAX4J980_9MICR
MEDENLNQILECIKTGNSDLRENAINMLIDLLKSSHAGSISTMNFNTLMEKKPILLELCDIVNDDQKRKLHDIISSISIMGDDSEILKHRILGNIIPLQEWGHLYVKKLIGVIVKKKLDNEDIKDATEVSNSCIEFFFKNNLEFDAIDFLLEIENIGIIYKFVEKHNYKRIILYLQEMSFFYELYEILNKIYLKMEDYSRYIINIIDNGYYDDAIDFIEKCQDKKVKKQLLYILARCNIFYETKDLEEKSILMNNHIKGHYRNVIKVYELDSENTKSSTFRKLRYEKEIKGLQQNSFNPITVCNGFINLGYGQDNIFFPREGNAIPGIDHQAILSSDIPELITIIGSVGCIEFWNPNKVMEILQEHIFGDLSIKRTGALLALSLSSSMIHDENKTILSFLTSNLESNDPLHVVPTLLGIQSMYCNTFEEELKVLLTPLIYSENIEISSFAAFTLGSIFVGTGDEELLSLILQMYIEKEDYADTHYFKLIMLGLALLFYRRPDLDCIIDNMDFTYARHAAILIKGFQNIKTGDHNMVEDILTNAFSGETDGLLESLALLSCCLVGLGDDLAMQMISRICTSSQILESPHLKSVLPLCYSLLFPSTMNQNIVDNLEKNINSGDSSIVIPSLYALGIVGCGTVSGKIQKILDSHYSQAYKDPKLGTILRISNGLLSLGKGLSSISYSLFDKSCIIPKNFIGLFTTTFLMLDSFSSPLLSGNTFLFYLLNQSFIPKYIVTQKKTNIRIGTPVNTVGVVGDPRRITSMQTHSTPVIINGNERAEIDEMCYTSFIEDVIILKDE